MQSADTRLFQFVSDAWADHHPLVLNAPCERTLTYEPRALEFLEHIAGYHLGKMNRPSQGRHSQVYEECVDHFHTIFNLLDRLLPKLIFRLRTKAKTPDGFAFFLLARNPSDLIDVYMDHSIYETYPVHNLWERLHTTMLLIVSHHSPHFQTLLLDDLPNELLRSVASFACGEDLESLSWTSRKMRNICIPELFHTCTLSMKYHRSFNFRTVTNLAVLHARVIRFMRQSRNSLLQRLQHTISNDTRRVHIRELVLSNDWETQFPPFLSVIRPLPPQDLEMFGLVYHALRHFLAHTTLLRITLCALAITNEILCDIAQHESLRELHLRSCTPDITLDSLSQFSPLLRIRSLSIDFPIFVVENQLRKWLLLALCPFIRQLHVYTTTDIGVLFYPSRQYYDALANSNYLERLHIHGSTTRTTSLTRWLLHNASTMPSRLTHFKLHCWSAIPQGNVLDLLDALAHSKHTLRVLALDGLLVVPVPLLAHIAHCLPELRALTLVRRANDRQRATTLCRWDAPLYEYALALATFRALEHFGANFDWSPYVYSPVLLDKLLEAEECDGLVADESDESSNADNTMEYEDPVAYKLLQESRELADCLSGSIDVAPSFAIHCPTLRSFAITGSSVVFSCQLSTSVNIQSGMRTYCLSDVRTDPQPNAFQQWNPHEGSWYLE